MSDLKKCPFCGNEPIQDYKAVYCRYCFMMDEPDVRVDTWNTRPLEDALQARITELEQQTIQYHHKKEDALQTELKEKLEIIDEQAETIVNFAYEEMHLKAKLDIAVEWIRLMVINDGTHADISISAERILKKLEK